MTRLPRLVVVSIVLVSILTIPAGTAGAQPADDERCSLASADPRSLVDTLNRNVEAVPGFARSQFGGERIDVRVDTGDGERRFTVVTARTGRITDFEAGAPADPTLRVETTESTFCDVVTADDPKGAFAAAYFGGDIDVSGVGTVNAVKVGAVEIGASIGKALADLL